MDSKINTGASCRKNHLAQLNKPQQQAKHQAFGTYLSTEQTESLLPIKRLHRLQRDIPKVHATCCGKLKGGVQKDGQSPQTDLLEQRCSSTHVRGSNLH